MFGLGLKGLDFRVWDLEFQGSLRGLGFGLGGLPLLLGGSWVVIKVP